jgi:hypothetical protein
MQIAAFGAGKSTFRVENGAENDKCRLDGGGGSRMRTLLRLNSLVTGKNTGNIAPSVEALEG